MNIQQVNYLLCAQRKWMGFSLSTSFRVADHVNGVFMRLPCTHMTALLTCHGMDFMKKWIRNGMDHSAACLFRNCCQNRQIHPTISATVGSQWFSHQPTVLKDASIAAFVPFHVVDTMTLPNSFELDWWRFSSRNWMFGASRRWKITSNGIAPLHTNRNLLLWIQVNPQIVPSFISVTHVRVFRLFFSGKKACPGQHGLDVSAHAVHLFCGLYHLGLPCRAFASLAANLIMIILKNQKVKALFFWFRFGIPTVSNTQWKFDN